VEQPKEACSLMVSATLVRVGDIDWGEMEYGSMGQITRAIVPAQPTVGHTSEVALVSVTMAASQSAPAVKADARVRRSAGRKRIFETTVALVFLVVVLPMLLVIAAAIFLTGGGPVLFRQPRVGQGGRRFTMLKFRTFPVDHVDDVQTRPLSDCPSRLGRLLRRTSLDELPQILNVVRGDMALVGPRPERPHFVESLAETVPGYEKRHRVPGGITGLAQVNGYWGETDLTERVRLDNEYIDHWSLVGDVGILIRTLPAVIRKARG
jgi:lipopolysaccharide/colanic/teichoic acid biosynthesis glycosyltransferase